MKNLLAVILCVFGFYTVLAQTHVKKISRLELESYLSKTVDILGLNEYCKHNSRHHPVTGDEIVNPSEFVTMPPPSSVTDYFRYNDFHSGNLYSRYQSMLSLIGNVKPKMILDCVTQWGAWDMAHNLTRARNTVKDIKAIDPNIVVGASANEFISINQAGSSGNIPKWVFDAFGQPYVVREFDIYNMYFLDWHYLYDLPAGDPLKKKLDKRWWYNDIVYRGTPLRPHPVAIVPDISRLETKMWFYYLGRTYIDMGCELISFAQVHLMNDDKDDPTHWNVVFQKLRAYADTKPDIRFLLISGHSKGMKDAAGNLSFDFRHGPSRPSELLPVTSANGGGAVLTPEDCPGWGSGSKYYNNGMGGVTPSGWYCTSLPGLVFIDNYGNDNPSSAWGTAKGAGGDCTPYYFDEITWFALQSESYRNAWLKYAYYKVRCIDPTLYLSLPIKRGVSYSSTIWYDATYLANNPNNSTLPRPNTIGGVYAGYVDRNTVQLCAGYGQENTIKAILNGSLKDIDNWVHHNFSDEDVYLDLPPVVGSSLIFVGSDRAYYIRSDGGYINGYIKDNGSPGVWRTICPSHSAQTTFGQMMSSQVPAKSNLVASPDGNTLLYIGTDNYLHGFIVHNVWDYEYFDMPRTATTYTVEKNGLVYASDSRIYYIGNEPKGKRIHGFIKSGSTWLTCSPTHSSGVSWTTMQEASGALTYDANKNRLYYVGTDGLLYYHTIINDWSYTYNSGPNSLLIAQNIRMPATRLAINGDRIYYMGFELGSSTFRIHALIETGTTWNTVSPSHSAALFSGQPLSTQVQPKGYEISVSPDGQLIAYVGNDNKVYYYKDLGSSNFSYNKPYLNSTYASNSLQYSDNETLFFVSSGSTRDFKVHYYKLQESFCQNDSIFPIEPAYSWYEKRTSEDEGNLDILNNPDLFDKDLITKIDQYADITVYPNPAKDNINVLLNDKSTNAASYAITNVLGVKVIEANISENLTNNVLKINSSELPAGLYILDVLDKNKSSIIKSKVLINR